VTANGHILLFIVVAFALFVAGRRWQRMADLWKAWRDSVAAVPARRKEAQGGVWAMVRIVLVVAVIFWAVAKLSYFL
jgi:hypothetical protein